MKKNNREKVVYWQSQGHCLTSDQNMGDDPFKNDKEFDREYVVHGDGVR